MNASEDHSGSGRKSLSFTLLLAVCAGMLIAGPGPALAQSQAADSVTHRDSAVQQDSVAHHDSTSRPLPACPSKDV